MMKSLQEMQDYYVNQGLSGSGLRNALQNDQEYQHLLLQRKSKLRSKYQITDEEAQRYMLVTDADYEILGKIHQLEKQNPSAGDKKLEQLIKTQLELDWRSPIIAKLDQLLRKYRQTP